MFRRTVTLLLSAALILICFSSARAEESGLFDKLSRMDGADERLPLLEKAAENVSSVLTADPYTVEICQVYYEGDRIWISYRAKGANIQIQDGLDLENGVYADITAGDWTVLDDGSIIGWKECTLPDGSEADPQTFYLVFGKSYEHRVGITVRRNPYEQFLQGSSSAASCPAQADLAMGRVDLSGSVLLNAPDQASSWLAWQEGKEGSGTDVISCWNLYQNGIQVAYDLYGASSVLDSGEILFEVVFPRPDDVNGLSLVPEYLEAGEKPDEAIALTVSVPGN